MAILRAGISGRVWGDGDGDGVFDPGEPGLFGVLIILSGAGDDGVFGTVDDLAFGPQSTDLEGQFSFVNLYSGLYRVTLDTSSPSLAGLQLVSGSNPLVLALGAGQDYDSALFGYLPSTAVQLVDFQVLPVPGGTGLQLLWQAMGLEPQPAGFIVWRDVGDGSWLRVTDEPLMPRWRRGQVALYSYRDREVGPGQAVRYRLQSTDGGALFGPWPVQVPAARRALFLPFG